MSSYYVFKIAICQDCEDIQFVCNKFFIFLFSLIHPLWNGRAITEYDITFDNIKEWEYEEEN